MTTQVTPEVAAGGVGNNTLMLGILVAWKMIVRPTSCGQFVVPAERKPLPRTMVLRLYPKLHVMSAVVSSSIG